MPGLYRDEGIVLRAIKLGEADRIVTIFTLGHGKIRAVALTGVDDQAAGRTADARRAADTAASVADTDTAAAYWRGSSRYEDQRSQRAI